MTLEETEQRISEIYHWFAKEAPGVVVREEGELSALWSLLATNHPEEYPNG